MAPPTTWPTAIVPTTSLTVITALLNVALAIVAYALFDASGSAFFTLPVSVVKV